MGGLCWTRMFMRYLHHCELCACAFFEREVFLQTTAVKHQIPAHYRARIHRARALQGRHCVQTSCGPDFLRSCSFSAKERMELSFWVLKHRSIELSYARVLGRGRRSGERRSLPVGTFLRDSAGHGVTSPQHPSSSA